MMAFSFPPPAVRPFLSLKSLSLIEWKEGGTYHKFYFMKELSSTWYTMWHIIGEKLEIGAESLKNIFYKSDDNVLRLQEVFKCWIADNGHPNYPLTWDGLFKLLFEMERSTVAEELKRALRGAEHESSHFTPPL